MKLTRTLTATMLAIWATFASLPVWSDDLVAEGIKAYRAGNFAKSELIYRQALTTEKDKPKLAAIYRNLAVLFSAQGKDSTEFSKKADELDPPVKSPNSIQADKMGSVLMINNPSQAQTILRPQVPQQNVVQYSGGNGSLMQTPQGGISVNYINSGAPAFQSFSRSGPNSSPLYGNSGFSGKFENGSFDYSNGSTIVLPKPNGGAVILNAPGPNIQSTQQGPDGSSTTIIKRTY